MAKKTTKKNRSRQAGTGRGPLKLGEENEYRIARLFVWMGYFVRRGREIYTTSRLDQATDLDVLAFRYRDAFSKETITIESKTGREGPLDRVFWLSGIKHYVGADRALLYRKPTKWNIRDFAKDAGVEILDPDRLATLESRYVREPDSWLGLCDWEFLSQRAESWNRILATHEKYKELYQTLVVEVRYDEPFALIAFWIHHLRGLTRDLTREKSAEVQELVKFLIADAAGQLAVFLLRVAQSTADLAERDRSALVAQKLVYGEQDPQLVDRVFESSHKVARAAIRDKLRTDVELEGSLFSVPEPDYVQDVVELVEDLVRNVGLSTDLPQIVDIIMSEWFLKGNKHRRVLKHIFPGDGLVQRTALAQSFLRSLRKLEAVPEEVDELLSLGHSTLENESSESPQQGTLLL